MVRYQLTQTLFLLSGRATTHVQIKQHIKSLIPAYSKCSYSLSHRPLSGVWYPSGVITYYLVEWQYSLAPHTLLSHITSPEIFPFLHLYILTPLPLLSFEDRRPWPCLDLALTFTWTCLDLALNLPWPCLYLSITLPWTFLDLSLNLTWPWQPTAKVWSKSGQ